MTFLLRIAQKKKGSQSWLPVSEKLGCSPAAELSESKTFLLASFSSATPLEETLNFHLVRIVPCSSRSKTI